MLIKKREALLKKQAFKVLPRGYIRYLVRYVIYNIYKILVLVLKYVIITKNIAFNKEVCYLAELKRKEGQLILIIKDIIKLIKKDKI